VRGVGGLLDDGGTAQLLANWAITGDETTAERLAGWLPDEGVDVWAWQREVADPAEYVSLWLRDGGLQPGSAEWRRRYDQWLDWFADFGVLGVGMGLVTIRRSPGPSSLVVEDVPQAISSPSGPAIAAWFERQSWLRSHDVLDRALVASEGLVLDTSALIAAGEGWQPALSRLRQSYGLRWEVETDEIIAGLVAGCDGYVPVSTLIGVVAASYDLDPTSVAEAVRPVLIDLVQRGFLEPTGAD